MDNKQLLIYGGVFVAGAGTGVGAGYLIFKKKFERLAQEEIESVREVYRKAAVPKPDISVLKPDTIKVATSQPEPTQEGIIASSEYASSTEEPDAAVFQRIHGRVPTTFELELMDNGTAIEDAIVRDRNDDADSILVEGNVFDFQADEDPEVTEQASGVEKSDRPFIIDHTEWYANELGYDQITLTYWADDEVLAGDNNVMITDIDRIVGASNLMGRWGFKSDNPDIVYVRNDERKADYEITKDERNFTEVIHGIPADEINNSGIPRRMRRDDE